MRRNITLNRKKNDKETKNVIFIAEASDKLPRLEETNCIAPENVTTNPAKIPKIAIL